MTTVNATLQRRLLPLLWLVALAAGGCSSKIDGSGIALGGSTPANDPVAPDAAIAYIKRPLPNPADPNATPLEDDIRVQEVWNGPADVYLRDRASPSAAEHNLTAAIAGGPHDVRDLDVSFDAKKLLFSLRLQPPPNAKEAVTPKWQLYEYDVASKTVQPLDTGTFDLTTSHCVGGHYLPSGDIVFSSTRQYSAKATLIDELKPQFAAGLEFANNRNRPAFVLHVLSADRSKLRQISFNTGHDLDPSVLADGRIVFTRWDIANNSGMQLYSVLPDGSQLQLLYGRNSHDTGTPGSVVQFTQARSRQDGRVVALLMPFAGTEFGGDPVLISHASFVENLQGVLGVTASATATGQIRLVTNDVVTTPAATVGGAVPVSTGGRYASVFPLWDGSNRLLVSWSGCRLLDQTVIVACTPANLAKPGVVAAPPLYGLWIYDRNSTTQLPVVAPVEGIMYTGAVVLEPRGPADLRTVSIDAFPVPSAGGPYTFALDAEGTGVLDIRSVYDFDGCNLAPGGTASGACPTPAPAARPRAAFVRIEKAVSLPDSDTIPNTVLQPYVYGAAGNFMREIIGYAPVEPDGSVRVKVPGNIPFTISVLDANGRRLGSAFPRHRNWMQLRVGETLTCNGCHLPNATTPPQSHGRRGLFAQVNTGSAGAGQFPGTDLTIFDRSGNPVPKPLARQPAAGETMAEYRARAQVTCIDAVCAAYPAVDLVFSDVWTPAGGTPASPFAYTYAQLGTPAPTPAACASNWQSNCRVVIHYPTHIAPLWVTPRALPGAPPDPVTLVAPTTCIGCHSPRDAAGAARLPAGQMQLDLSSTPATGTGCVQQEFTSFCQLLFAHVKLDPVTLQPVPGPIDPNTGLPVGFTTVGPPMSGAGANASTTFFNVFSGATPTTPSHAGWLSGAELKLLSEWLDLGAQYYNDPYAVPTG